MREISEARQGASVCNLKAGRVERVSPFIRTLKTTWPSPAAPFAIVDAANQPIPPSLRNIFINYNLTGIAQHAPEFTQQYRQVLSVVQHIAEQHCVQRSGLDGKASPIKRPVIDPCFSGLVQIDSHYGSIEHSGEMMRDVSVAAADIQDAGARPYLRECATDFKRHIVSAPDFPTPPLAPPALGDTAGKAAMIFGQIVISACYRSIPACSRQVVTKVVVGSG